jgi:tetratricopeptide (TPR) repeat protein
LEPSPPLDPRVAKEIQSAMLHARKGDLGGARRAAEAALVIGKDQAVVQGLLGMLCCQGGDLEAGIRYLRAAYAARADDLGVASNLVMALIETGHNGEALAICTAALAKRDPSARLWRMRGFLLQETEDFSGAAEAYQAVVVAHAADFESWNNLGNALAALGRWDESTEAIERAVKLRPDVAPMRLNLATTMLEAGRLEDAVRTMQKCVADFPDDGKAFLELGGMLKEAGRDAEALDALRRAAALSPHDADVQVKLGMELVNSWTWEGAEDAFLRAVAIEPKHAEAHILRALVLEHTNQPEALSKGVATAEQLGVDFGAANFIRALAYRREKRFEEGLAALSEVPAEIEPIRCAQLAGQFLDRLGRAEESFGAFTEMNRLQRLDPSDPARRAEQYRAELDADRETVTQSWYDSWTPAFALQDRPTPTFLVGFPRSGTTLLDTLLMGHPDVAVLEERPLIGRVEAELGGWDRLAALTADEISELRSIFFREAENWIDLSPHSLIVDKYPLHLNKVPVIHRLFPDAKFILALRHPCDVVLSAYITNFRLNNAMSNFTDLEHTARVYDKSFGFWQHCRDLMPINVHEIEYERVVADMEAELRPLFAFLGLQWNDDVLDHQRTASDRGLISTASYSQVTEPIYDRASGRWTRYREQLSPVIPILQPWIERFGYSL